MPFLPVACEEASSQNATILRKRIEEDFQSSKNNLLLIAVVAGESPVSLSCVFGRRGGALSLGKIEENCSISTSNWKISKSHEHLLLLSAMADMLKDTKNNNLFQRIFILFH